VTFAEGNHRVTEDIARSNYRYRPQPPPAPKERAT
jgi:hypothetical protein